MSTLPTNAAITARLFALFAIFLLSCAIAYADILLLGNRISEDSLVEIAHVVFGFLSAVIFFLASRKLPQKKGYLLIFATLFLMMFIRENDRILDHIDHGFWFYPTLLVAIIGAVAIWRNKEGLPPAFRAHAPSGGFWILMVGLFQLLICSRLLGSGNLWEEIPHDLGDEGATAVKTIVQEVIELISYALILLGSIFSYWDDFESNRQADGQAD